MVAQMMDGQVDRQVDGCTHRWVVRWMGGQTACLGSLRDGQTAVNNLLLVPPPLQDCPGHSPAHPMEPTPATPSAREAPGRRKRSRRQRQLVEEADWAGRGMAGAGKFWEKKALREVSHRCILPPGRNCNFWVVPLRHHRTLKMRKYSEGHQNQRDCDTPHSKLIGDIHLSGKGKPPAGAGLCLPGRGARGTKGTALGAAGGAEAVPRPCRAPGQQHCLGQHPAPWVFPWVLQGTEAKPGLPPLVQHPNLSPRAVGECEQAGGASPRASGSAGMPSTTSASTSLLARVDFCLPQLDLGCKTPRGGTWVTFLSPLAAAIALFCIGVSGQPTPVSVQPAGCRAVTSA